jgi:hypothetical protein
MARRTGHEQVDHGLGFAIKVRLFRRERIVGDWRGQGVILEQTFQCNRTESNAALFKKPSAGENLGRKIPI